MSYFKTILQDGDSEISYFPVVFNLSPLTNKERQMQKDASRKKNPSLLKEKIKTQEIQSPWVRWSLRKQGGRMAAAGDGPGDKDKVVERPLLQAVGLRERRKDTTEQTSLHSSRKQTPFPHVNKTIGSREKTKPGKNYIC